MKWENDIDWRQLVNAVHQNNWLKPYKGFGIWFILRKLPLSTFLWLLFFAGNATHVAVCLHNYVLEQELGIPALNRGHFGIINEWRHARQ